MRFLLLFLVGGSLSHAFELVPPLVIINLDEPPVERWRDVALMLGSSHYGTKIKQLRAALPSSDSEIKSITSESKLKFFAENFPQPYKDELLGIAKYSNIPITDLTFSQIVFEFTVLCTSFVCADRNNVIWHARTLDYYGADDLKSLIINVEFQKNEKTVFKGSTFAGLVGLFTGMRPGAFGVTLNQRPLKNGTMLENMRSTLKQMKELNAVWPTSFQIRSVLQTDGLRYRDACKIFKSIRLMTTAYFIVSGLKGNEGSVITRNHVTTNIYHELDIRNGMWYIVQTNHDVISINRPAELLSSDYYHDSRFGMAEYLLKNVTQKRITSARLADIIRTEPITNDLSAYGTVMSAGYNYFHTFVL